MRETYDLRGVWKLGPILIRIYHSRQERHERRYTIRYARIHRRRLKHEPRYNVPATDYELVNGHTLRSVMPRQPYTLSVQRGKVAVPSQKIVRYGGGELSVLVAPA